MKSLSNMEISLSKDPIFLAQSSIFFNGFPISKKSEKIFFNGFPISSTAFRFLQRLSTFFNGFPIFLNSFPLSEKSGKIYLWQQVYERSLSKLRISAKIAIFRDKITGGKNTKDHYLSFVFFAPSFVILAN
jgi:hypothetical protein